MSLKPIRKGMILCAGLGTRLLPITETFPKPIVPVLNVANLLHTVHLLKRAGIEEIIVNLFHLSLAVENFLSQVKHTGVRFSFSQEKILLGTGGGLKKAEPFFEGEPFILANCDFVTNVDLAKVIEKHDAHRALATMVLLDDPNLTPHYASVGVDKEGHLVSLPKLQLTTPARTGMFTGIHILEPEVFAFLEEKPSGINEVLYPSLMKDFPHRVFGEFAENTYWFDTGDLPAFWKSSKALLAKFQQKDPALNATFGDYQKELEEKRPGVWAPAQLHLPEIVKTHSPVMIGAGVSFQGKAELGPNVIVGEDSIIADGSRVKDTFILPRSSVSGTLSSPGIFYQGKLLAV